jgi:catechol 2,3-dioxygenase-like lactoylglutathione lyase family enzyme
MAMMVEKISAVNFPVANMRTSVQGYRDVLGMELVYGGEDAFFSSLRAKDAEYPIPNLEQGRSVTGWGADDFLRGGCGCVLGIAAGQGI